jgi:pyochelin biosynthetic protein PchC
MNSIFLFPYGGGSAASYRYYIDRFPSHIGRVTPVELPGRGRKAHESHATSLQECAAVALEQIDPVNEGYVLHGHCMGALLAFEAIKVLEARGRPLPRFMVASGRNAPRHVNDWLRRVAVLDDRTLFKDLQELGGVPRGLSFAMAQPFLAVLRKDQAMFRDYDPGTAKISVPILALAGRDDAMTDAAALADWADYTSRFLTVEWLDGCHYFLLEQPDRAASHIDQFAKVVESLAPVERRSS